MDTYGDHALVCPCQGDRTKRHNALRNEAFFSLGAAGCSPELEKSGLLPPRGDGEGPSEHGPGGEAIDGNGRRPADVYVPRWRDGLPAAFDFAVTSGMRSDLLAASASAGSAAAAAYEAKKKSHLDTAALCANEGISFIPMVLEAHAGGWGLEARQVLAVMAKRISTSSGEAVDAVADKCAQRLSAVLQKENARAVLRRLPGGAMMVSSTRMMAATIAMGS